MNYILKTDWNATGKITQELLQDLGDGIVSVVTNWAVNSREEGIKRALVALGWTPPEGRTTPTEAEIERDQVTREMNQLLRDFVIRSESLIQVRKALDDVRVALAAALQERLQERDAAVQKLATLSNISLNDPDELPEGKPPMS
jgi:hypothetical protein